MRRVAVVLFATYAVAAPAAADPALRVELAPAELRFPGMSSLAYRVQITTGATVERFSLELRTARLPDGGAGMAPAGQPALDGSGVVTGGSIQVALPGCSPTHNLFHGYEPVTVKVDLVIPANTRTALVASYRAGAFTPWPQASIGVRVRALRRLSNGRVGTLSVAERDVPTPKPRLRLQQSGVRMALWTHPHSDATINGRASRIARGRPITVAGSTWPHLREERIRLAVVAPRSSRLQTLARVRTDSRGRFRYRGWRPRALGRYQLWAFYAGREGRFVPDHRCPRGFTLVAGAGG